MPILKGAGNTLLCSRFGYGKRISTRTKSVKIVRTGNVRADPKKALLTSSRRHSHPRPEPRPGAQPLGV
jgi:hypothetical protein